MNRSSPSSSTTSFSFRLPSELIAKEPPERRGIARDEVKLMVINRKNYQIDHARFYSLGRFLRPGDLLVFNASRTLPAVLNGSNPLVNSPIEVRLAEHLPDDSWLALVRCKKDDPSSCRVQRGMQINFGHGLTGTVYDRDNNIYRLWKIYFSKSGAELMELLYRHGQPVRYEYLSAPWDLDYYQTIYAREPGSAEMPSAGRAFTWKLLFDLKRSGVDSAYIVLHTGLSSYMDDTLDAKHLASEEEYFISEAAAAKINMTHSNGGRVIAVGTTVVRALESGVEATTGKATAMHGYTRLHITATHMLKTVNGLLTGLHEPEASHLDLLTAFIPAQKIHEAYDQAIKRKYLWHEFGDLNLIL
ncbi:MAG: S-adenosylmethionine:tRNA ribosyltransferase-isomerase [Thermoproteota archaeon]|nr:S-adenosylmethionine:tRNA ribosyltransferase-isomerase [Thermoproteota archaeon]